MVAVQNLDTDCNHVDTASATLADTSSLAAVIYRLFINIWMGTKNVHPLTTPHGQIPTQDRYILFWFNFFFRVQVGT